MYVKMEMVLFSVSNHYFFLIKDSFKSNYKGKSKIKVDYFPLYVKC